MASIFKFLIVAASFVISLIALRYPLNPRDSLLLSIALAFTVVADYFLLLSHRYEAGLLAFICVQIIYNMRYNGFRPAYSVVFAGGSYTLAHFAFGASVLISLALAYALLFSFSFAAAIRCIASGRYPYPNNYLVLAGMLCFAICDIFVGILNSGTGFAAQHAHTLIFLIWLFYIPAKLMLAASSFKFSEKLLKTS